MNIIILAAGFGTRMKSEIPKPLHFVNDKCALEIILNKILNINIKVKNIIIISSKELEHCIENNIQYKDLKNIIKNNNINFVEQISKNGTGGAVNVAIKSLYFDHKMQQTLIWYADQVLYSDKLLSNITQINSYLKIVAFIAKDQSLQYGRILTKSTNYAIYQDILIDKITEYKDLIHSNENISQLCNSGMFFVNTELLLQYLPYLKKSPFGEIYLTELVEIFNNNNINCQAIIATESECAGFNSTEELSYIKNNIN